MLHGEDDNNNDILITNNKRKIPATINQITALLNIINYELHIF